MALHKSITGVDVHVIYAFTYADAAARSGATGLVAADVGKVAKQEDNNSYWILQSYSPIVWAELTPGGVGPHAASHESGGSDEVPHQALAGAGSNTHAQIDGHLASTANPHGVTAAQAGAAPTTRLISTSGGLQGGGDLSADRTLSLVYGAAADTVCQGNDARLSDARVPLAHASTHASAGSDPVGHGVLGGRSDAGAHPAVALSTDTSAFNGVLSAADDTVQKALDTIDNIPRLRQTAHATVTVDTTTTSTEFLDLLTLQVTTLANSNLLVFASFSGSNSAKDRNNMFEITVDAVRVCAFGFLQPFAANGETISAAACTRVTGVAAGVRTVKLRWKTSGSTLGVFPVTKPDSNHATLLVEEVIG